jgi:hypothetical protein
MCGSLFVFREDSGKSGRDMAHLRLVPKCAPTRHDLEQQLDALAREYSVSKDKKVYEQMLDVWRRMQRFDDYRGIVKRRMLKR